MVKITISKCVYIYSLDIFEEAYMKQLKVGCASFRDVSSHLNGFGANIIPCKTHGPRYRRIRKYRYELTSVVLWVLSSMGKPVPGYLGKWGHMARGCSSHSSPSWVREIFLTKIVNSWFRDIKYYDVLFSLWLLVIARGACFRWPRGR